MYGSLSLGDWRWENDVVADVTSDYDRSDTASTYSVEIYAGGLPVGDAPQRQIMGGLKYKAPFGLTVNPVFKLNDKHYADYDPEDMDEAEVVGVFDDRQKVVDMWREIGLTCMQVAPGNF